MNKKPAWDIFKQQPIMLYHPALADQDGALMVAGVTKAKTKGIIWWAAGGLIAEVKTGQPGSGFVINPIPIMPKYVADEDCWIIEDKEDGLYKFCLPDREMLAEYEKFKQYLPTIERLKELTMKRNK